MVGAGGVAFGVVFGVVFGGVVFGGVVFAVVVLGVVFGGVAVVVWGVVFGVLFGVAGGVVVGVVFAVVCGAVSDAVFGVVFAVESAAVNGVVFAGVVFDADWPVAPGPEPVDAEFVPVVPAGVLVPTEVFDPDDPVLAAVDASLIEPAESRSESTGGSDAGADNEASTPVSGAELDVEV